MFGLFLVKLADDIFLRNKNKIKYWHLDLEPIKYKVTYETVTCTLS